MLPKHQRIFKQKEITRSFRTKFSVNSGNFKIFLSINKEAKFKLLVIVSKKIYKQAVKRNRIKRKIYAYFDAANNNKILPKGFNCIIQVKNKEILYKNQTALNQELSSNLKEVLGVAFDKIKKNINS